MSRFISFLSRTEKFGNLTAEKDLTNSKSGCIVFKFQYICLSGAWCFSMTCNFLRGSKIIGKIVKPLLDIESYSNDKIGSNREKRNNLYDKTLSDAFQHKWHAIFSGDQRLLVKWWNHLRPKSFRKVYKCVLTCFETSASEKSVKVTLLIFILPFHEEHL